ncbi:MAG TPA: DNA-binding response regulator [Candidatus Wallbacteria bacterium]|nr:DNA-binding response regulator [Candidatus Wallbacteria bacterium]
MEKLLLVEDDDKIADFIIKYAASENFAIRCESDGEGGLREAAGGGYDLIIVDIGLPGMNGLQLCRELRKKKSVPVIFLTAKDEEIDKILALEIGADDYITKPFSPRELFARIKAILRRTVISGSAVCTERTQSDDGGASAEKPGAPIGLAGKTIKTARLEIDIQRREVRVDGNTVGLTYTQFEILKKLAGGAGIVYSREQIYVGVWGEDGEGMSRTVDVHIKHIREALSAAADGYNPIISVRGAGYKFEDVRSV